MSKPPGIDATHLKKICAIFKNYPNVRTAVLFGSRAKGTHRDGSDIDIALKGDGITHNDLTRIEMDYDRLYLPWKLDLVVYNSIDNQALREHVDRVGMEIFSSLNPRRS